MNKPLSKNDAIFQAQVSKEKAMKAAEKSFREVIAKIRKEYDDKIESIETTYITFK